MKKIFLKLVATLAIFSMMLFVACSSGEKKEGTEEVKEEASEMVDEAEETAEEAMDEMEETVDSVSTEMSDTTSSEN